MKEYVLVLLPEETDALGNIRCMPGLQIAQKNHLYLRGISKEMMADKRLRQLPVLHSYFLDEEERLYPINGITPVSKLEPMAWQPLSDFIPVSLPVSALPGKIKNTLPIKLFATENIQDGVALLTDFPAWKKYAETASAIRLEQLQFAVSGNGDVLIIGTPPPALPGKEFYKQNNILLPAGYAFEVPLAALLLQQKLNASNDSLLLFTSSGAWHKIPLSSFVKATRSAVRLTEITELK